MWYLWGGNYCNPLLNPKASEARGLDRCFPGRLLSRMGILKNWIDSGVKGCRNCKDLELRFLCHPKFYGF